MKIKLDEQVEGQTTVSSRLEERFDNAGVEQVLHRLK